MANGSGEAGGVPTSFGPWTVASAIGRGGMATVYRCVHEDSGVVAAVKAIDAVHPRMLDGVRREIRALARIGHPGIVRILDQGARAGLPWYAMELLDGVSLTTFRSPSAEGLTSPLTVSPLTWSFDEPVDDEQAALDPSTAVSRLEPEALTRVLDLVRQLCDALAHLHAEGFVHRDLKPDNVMVVPERGAVLIDFGLAVRFGGIGSRESLDSAPRVAGTAQYMAPEQCLGRPVDARADLYALGCLLYELVTGRPPFDGGDPHALLRAHVSQPVVPPSQRIDGVPPALESLILRLLEKRPKDRLGYAEDVGAALEAMGATRVAPLASRPRPYLYRPELAGRDDALDRLKRQAQRLDEGVGGFTAVVGGSGSGKTRLVLEAMYDVAPGTLVLVASDAGGPLACMRGVLRRIADFCRAAGPEASARILGDRASVLAPFAPFLLGIPGVGRTAVPSLPDSEARVRTFRALFDVLATIAAERPVVLVVDDIQWADPSTQYFVDWMVRNGEVGTMPLWVVLAWRAEEAPGTVSALAALPHVDTVRLAPLDEVDVRSMAAGMLALSQLPGGLAHALVDVADGNPFAVSELLHTGINEGLLTRNAQGEWEVVDDLAALPTTLDGLIERRLSSLDPSAQPALAAAAVLGREIASDLLGFVLHDEAAGLDGPRELLREHVLVETAPGRFRFSHNRFRALAVAGLPEAVQADLHRRAAHALSELRSDEADLHMAELGRHWARAGEVDRARACFRKAADVAGERFAADERELLLHAWLDLDDRASDARVEVLCDLARMLADEQSRFDEARALLDQAEALLDRPEISDDGRATAWMTRSIFMFRTSEFEAALEAARAIVALGESVDPMIRARGIAAVGVVHQLRNESREALHWRSQALEIFRELDAERPLLIELISVAQLEAQVGGLERAVELFRDALERAQALALPPEEANILFELASIEAIQGRLSDAIDTATLARERARAGDWRRGELSAAVSLAHYRLLAGRLGEAEVEARHALDVAREASDLRFEATATWILGAVLVLEDRAAEALDLLEPICGRVDALGGSRASQPLVWLSRAQWALGMRGESVETAERALEGVRGGNPEFELSVCHWLARLRRLTGRPEEAAPLLERSLALAERLGDPGSQALAHSEQGLVELALGGSAASSLASARTALAALDAGPDAEAARAVAALAGAIQDAEP